MTLLVWYMTTEAPLSTYRHSIWSMTISHTIPSYQYLQRQTSHKYLVSCSGGSAPWHLLPIIYYRTPFLYFNLSLLVLRKCVTHANISLGNPLPGFGDRKTVSDTDELTERSLRRQDISSHDIDYVEKAILCLTRGGVSTTRVLSFWSIPG